jgi:hypothetical protein
MKTTKIQWCHSTVNPVMGCDGCELWKSAAAIRAVLLALLLRFTSLSGPLVRHALAQVFGDPRVGVQSHETVLEGTYRFNLRKGALFFQPDVQYVMRPGGTGQLANAVVLGCQLGVNF